jgi:signal transduction histidine kinase
MKILHLEDNARDAALVREVFREEWPDCRVKLVDNRADFLTQLADPHDIILSDFNLVNFNGLEALHLAREKTPDIPFIFLSGTIGEDRALEALRSGASDYVIKDRPKRLIPAMRRALNDAKLQRERRAAEEQMLRVQRLENIGMLAAGIAHDFNNVLAPVLMGIPLLRPRVTGESDQRILTSMESSIQRGAGLVRQILGFAHGVTGEPQLIQPKHLISELMDIIQQTFPKTIRIQGDIGGGLWPLEVNPTQFHQVLLNLCVNARDAMPRGGTLRLHAVNQQLDEVGAAAISGARPGPYLLIEVSDTGTGIPPEVIERMWDPFFTTKGADRGTGLGLATVRGIVNGQGGVITVQTRVGYGTAFQILLPASPGSECVVDAAASAAIPRGQGELILVVDDDASVRDVTGATLTDHGYRVLAAADGTEALALFAPRSLEIRAVITDLDMPNLDGSALIRVVRTLNPAIRILTISGSADVDDPRRRAPQSGKFLAKPFNAKTLLGSIHELLQSRTTAPWPTVAKSGGQGNHGEVART